MNDFATVLALLSMLTVSVASTYLVAEAYRRAQESEGRRVADWWERSQRHIDNLQDRVMAKEWEIYAQATTLERPSDQPTFTADGELTEPGMARDLIDEILRNRRDAGYDEDTADVAEDYGVGPIIG